jgi:hypothetical protein
MSDFLDKLVIWQPSNAAPRADGGLYATHFGTFKIGDLTLRCYRLSGGQRVIEMYARKPPASATRRKRALHAYPCTDVQGMV